MSQLYCNPQPLTFCVTLHFQGYKGSKGDMGMPGASGDKGTTGLPGLPVRIHVYSFLDSEKSLLMVMITLTITHTCLMNLLLLRVSTGSKGTREIQVYQVLKVPQ